MSSDKPRRNVDHPSAQTTEHKPDQQYQSERYLEHHWVFPKLSQIPTDLVSLADYERYAEAYFPKEVWAYINGGGADEITLNQNRSAFDQIALYNRILNHFDQASTHSTLLGSRLKYPIMLAPVAYHALAHPDAELATVAAANAMQTGMIASTLSSVPMEAIAANLDQLHWFQLYFQANRHDTLGLLRRAEAAGFSAIVVTLDAVINGFRNREQRAGFALPSRVQAANLQDLTPPTSRELTPEQSIILNGIMADAPNWDDLKWLREQTSLPILIKGISHPHDAQRIMELGCQGVIVSNHGGRTLDTIPASIQLLPAIRTALGKEPIILLDSGVRRGTDVIKAIALGANAVLIGRPQLYGLAVAGSLGVAHMLRLLIEEFEISMALTGCAEINMINSDLLV